MGALTREEILRRLRERILAFATSRGLREGAEDLTQDVLMVLHEKYTHVTELTELVPLSFQILRYKMLKKGPNILLTKYLFPCHSPDSRRSMRNARIMIHRNSLTK